MYKWNDEYYHLIFFRQRTETVDGANVCLAFIFYNRFPENQLKLLEIILGQPWFWPTLLVSSGTFVSRKYNLKLRARIMRERSLS